VTEKLNIGYPLLLLMTVTRTNLNVLLQQQLAHVTE